MSYTIIGSCSKCGGTVQLFTGPWYGIVPPTPICSSCGAKPKLPVIQMGESVTQQEFDGFFEKEE